MINQETICMTTSKVYDWIVGQIDVPSRTYRGIAGLERLNFSCEEISEQTEGGPLVSECIPTDAAGNPIDPLLPGSIICTEITQPGGRRNVDVILPSGEAATLQEVMTLISGHYVIEISNASGVTCTSSPQSFSVVQRFLLCAPEGTTIKCDISDFECFSCNSCSLDGEGNQQFQQLEVSIRICHSLQVERNVTLCINANICQPRSAELEGNCPQISIPQQCTL
ncbi:hypothetical protein [Metabacillus niabensis]|uniref:hypothetical protein n=1 Tax=Metabacillus niabensis TaxID=324854 RepID=UPI001CF95A0B|nr:hypothetical protein [Metabacillus niabensis]